MRRWSGLENRLSYLFVERLFVIVLLLSSMGVVDALTRSPAPHGRDLEVISTDVPLPTVIIESSVYACGALLVFMRWRRVFNAARAVWPMLGFPILALLSTAWSIQPMLTARRSVFLLGSTLLGIYVGERFSTEQFARYLAQAVCIMMMAVLLMYFAAPDLVVSYDDYGSAWKGLSVTKNGFGGYMVISVAVLLLARFRHFQWLRYLFLFTAAILLLLSHSATSLLACVLIVAAMPLWRLHRLRGTGRLLLYATMPPAISAVIFLIWANSEVVFQVLGRDSTLTGRTDLWALVVPAIMHHPILGYGYGAFWSGMNGEPLDIFTALKWLPMEAHNGYLELCLDFGVLGLPVLFYVILRSFRMAHHYLKTNSGPLGLWPLTYFTFFILHNVSESHLLETRSLEFLMFAAITTSLVLNRCQDQVRPPLRAPHVLAAKVTGVPLFYGCDASPLAFIGGTEAQGITVK
jgi:exopolysaccharide production protein ExoQ